MRTRRPCGEPAPTGSVRTASWSGSRSRSKPSCAASRSRPEPESAEASGNRLRAIRVSVSLVYRSVAHDGVHDAVAIEEPLEIRVSGVPLAVAMRTPGHDEELALGFLYGEGLIDGPREAGLTEDLANNTIEVGGPLTRDPGMRRFYTTSSCGVCGKGALEEVAGLSPPLSAEPTIPRGPAAER